MAKIIFRSNTVNNGYTIGYDSIEAPDNSSVKSGGIKKTAKIKISPKPGFIVDANNFINGLLPNHIQSVEYNNSYSKTDVNNEVIASITLSDDFVMGKSDVIFEIPISGSSEFPSNEVVLIEETIEHVHIISSTTHGDDVACGHTSSPVYNSSKPEIKTTRTEYTASGEPGSKINLLQKRFTAINGYYLFPPPSYKLETNNKSNYKVKIYNEYDREKRLVAKIFNVYYTFPDKRTGAVDTITFTSDMQPIIIKKNEPGYKETITPEIYSISQPSKSGPEGGIQFIKVTGTPGAKYKLLIQNKEKQVYDVDRGAFLTGGKFFEGEIPNLQPNATFGIASIPIVIPSIDANTTSATNANYNSNLEIEDNVEVRLMASEDTKTQIKTDDKRVDGEGRSIGGVTTSDTATKQRTRSTINMIFTSTATDDFIISNAKLRRLDIETRRVINETNYTTIADFVTDNTPIEIVGVSGLASKYIYELEYTVNWDTPASPKFIRVVRQPRFSLWDGVDGSDSSHRAWACSSGTTCDDTNDKLYTSAGKTIYNDWQLFTSTSPYTTAETSNRENKYRINSIATGFGEARLLEAADGSTQAKFYPSVVMKHTFSKIIHGDRGITLDLKHKNFLSLDS